MTLSQFARMPWKYPPPGKPLSSGASRPKLPIAVATGLRFRQCVQENLLLSLICSSIRYTKWSSLVGDSERVRKLLKSALVSGVGMSEVTCPAKESWRLAGIMLFGNASRTNPPIPSSRVVAGSKTMMFSSGMSLEKSPERKAVGGSVSSEVGREPRRRKPV